MPGIWAQVSCGRGLGFGPGVGGREGPYPGWDSCSPFSAGSSSPARWWRSSSREGGCSEAFVVSGG